MTELVSRSPLVGLMPLNAGTVRCNEVSFDAITSVAPLNGTTRQVSAALRDQIGAAFPAPNRTTGRVGSRAVWCGRGQALVLGPVLAPIDGATLTDQTDAWACAALEGPGTRDVLARLVPLDLRPADFAVGHAARTQLGHMNCVFMRTGSDRYELMVFRSMARTLAHEVKSAMEAVAARG